MSTSYQGRTVAKRVFAREFNSATYTFKESDDEQAPVYILLPTGEKANRIFIVGTLTETDNVGGETEYWRGRVVDPVGTFFLYAGEYQPEASRFLREVDPPIYAAVVGKPRTYETDSGRTNVSVRPESIGIVDEATRERWVVETAERTINRIIRYNESENTYITLAKKKYGETIEKYKDDVINALESLERT